MKSTLLLAASFTAAALIVLLLADVSLSGVYQGGPSSQHRQEALLLHAAFHGSVLVLSASGAVLGFLLLRHQAPTLRQALILGAVFGLVSVLGASGSLMLAGVAGAAAWLFLGSLAFALGGGLFKKPWRG